MTSEHKAVQQSAHMAAWRRERRDVARRLHPDVGGTTEDYLAALREVDRRYGLYTEAALASSRLRMVLRRARRFRRRARGLVRQARARLPRSVPGARRYINLDDGPNHRHPDRPEPGPPTPEHPETDMSTSTIGLIAGLLLGIAAAVGGFFGFLLALVLGVLGYAVGGQLDGEFDLAGLFRGGRRG